VEAKAVALEKRIWKQTRKRLTLYEAGSGSKKYSTPSTTLVVSVTKEDIYQHSKQFQQFLLLATLYASLSLPDKNFQSTLCFYSFQTGMWKGSWKRLNFCGSGSTLKKETRSESELGSI